MFSSRHTIEILQSIFYWYSCVSCDHSSGFLKILLMLSEPILMPFESARSDIVLMSARVIVNTIEFTGSEEMTDWVGV